MNIAELLFLTVYRFALISLVCQGYPGKKNTSGMTNSADHDQRAAILTISSKIFLQLKELNLQTTDSQIRSRVGERRGVGGPVLYLHHLPSSFCLLIVL